VVIAAVAAAWLGPVVSGAVGIDTPVALTAGAVLQGAGIGLLVADRVSRGQPAATIRRVGLLSFSSEAAGAHLRIALKQGMQDLGWMEGINVEYRVVYANGAWTLGRLAGELIRRKSR
jgi:hypothetical protein